MKNITPKIILSAILAITGIQFTTSAKADITIYPTVVVTNNYTGGTGCPGGYYGYANYIKPAPTFGWKPDANAPAYTATDNSGRNTVVEYTGKLMDRGCNAYTVTVPKPALSTAYRFTVYFKQPLGGPIGSTNNYPLTLSGFLP